MEKCVKAFHRWLPCVSMAPLGKPVVPDVYISDATSSVPTRATTRWVSPLAISCSYAAPSPAARLSAEAISTTSRTRLPAAAARATSRVCVDASSTQGAASSRM